ncbi:MAG: hypothetical protein IJU20_07755 [Clostridia bacterium]|jgi:hypothetical protein|nr:hypothetical protein [Clostridia bacterium]
MSKRKRIVLLVLIVAILIGGVCMIIIQNKTPNVKGFEFNDYQYYVDSFPSEENVGNIIDAKDAIKKAEKIWIKLYGESIKKEKPYQVFYDEDNGIWLIQGTLRSNMKGGVANILIQNKTGKVLAVWHEK